MKITIIFPAREFEVGRAMIPVMPLNGIGVELGSGIRAESLTLTFTAPSLSAEQRRRWVALRRTK